MLHWFNLELWGPMWPNLAASLVTFTAAGLWARAKLLERDLAHLERHNELKRMLNRQAPSGDAGDTPTLEETDDDLRP